jgi:hypothetical protein
MLQRFKESQKSKNISTQRIFFFSDLSWFCGFAVITQMSPGGAAQLGRGATYCMHIMLLTNEDQRL